MTDYLTLTNLTAIFVLFLLLLVGFVSFAKQRAYKIHSARTQLKVLKIKPVAYDNLSEILKTIEMPFVFEASVHQLGKDVNYYLIVPASRIEETKDKIGDGIELVDDYNVFHSGGSHIGIAVHKKNDWLIVSFPELIRNLDFSKVNEIGEGVAIQLVGGKKTKEGLAANLRIMISAPTPYQAQEILLSLKPAFDGFKLLENKSKSFIEKFVFRQFDNEESVIWKNP